MTIQTLIIGTTLLICNKIYAEEVKDLPITAQDIADHMGIHSFKWSYEAQKPFNESKIELIEYKRDVKGVFKKVVLSTDESGSSRIKDAGTYPITLLLSEKRMSLNAFNSKSSGAGWKFENKFTYYKKPLYIDGEYIVMATWSDNVTRKTGKKNMKSYICMTIETTKN